MSSAEIYAPFVAVFETAAKKRHIHKCEIFIGQHDPNFGLFLQTKITPHRSKGGVCLMFQFSTVRRPGTQKPMVRVNVETWSKGYECDSGAVTDALMLIAELVAGWTAIIEDR